VMTPDQWADLTGPMWGSFEDALDDVKQTLTELRPEERFAVYSKYRLVGSTEPALPTSTPFTPAPGGRWKAYPSREP